MDETPRYWFPAKRYGWGWGWPRTWEGRTVVAAFFALLVVDFLVFPPARRIGWFLGFEAAALAALIAVCWLKGEPARWRWGDD